MHNVDTVVLGILVLKILIIIEYLHVAQSKCVNENVILVMHLCSGKSCILIAVPKMDNPATSSEANQLYRCSKMQNFAFDDRHSY